MATTYQHNKQVLRLCCLPLILMERRLCLKNSTCHIFPRSCAPGFCGRGPRAHLEWLMSGRAGHSISQGPLGKHRKLGQSSATQSTGRHMPACSTCFTLSPACCTTCCLLPSGQGCSWGWACSQACRKHSCKKPAHVSTAPRGSGESLSKLDRITYIYVTYV